MAFNSNGQISYLVLDSLSETSKYGLEIIEYISQKTGGNFILKKPSLYSCLTRMEKKGLVSSSYWGESEMGGKRHYYTITNAGRESLEELSKEFSESFQTVSQDDGKFLTEDEKFEPEEACTSDEEKVENDPVFLQQGNIFDIVKNDKKEETMSQNEVQSDVLENQLDLFSLPPAENIDTSDSSEQEKMEYYQTKLEQENKLDDAKFLNSDEKLELTPDQNEQNRRLYDTSNELKKYRKRKSFSENQIEMSVVYENDKDEEIQRERIQKLKQSMLDIKQNGFNQVQEESLETAAKPQTEIENDILPFKQEILQTETKEDERKDDAILITNPRINEIPIQRKITPPNIEVNIYDDNLPAPKRDSSLEPTYKDMMAKLFERKKEKKIVEEPIVQESYPEAENFADYATLKKYYKSHGIDFNEYKKSSVERKHNTNLLNFIGSSILLLLSGVFSSILFGIISATGNLNSSTNFMFYVVPILFFVYCVYAFVKYRAMPSKKATLLYNAVINWAVFILASLVIFVINIACGMQFEAIGTYMTSILLPILAVLLAFPINYHIKKFVYKKFSK